MMRTIHEHATPIRWESEVLAERLARYRAEPRRYGHLVCHNGRMVDGIAMYPLPLRTRLILWLRKLWPTPTASAKYPQRLSG